MRRRPRSAIRGMYGAMVHRRSPLVEKAKQLATEAQLADGRLRIYDASRYTQEELRALVPSLKGGATR